MNTPLSNEKQLLADIDRLREEFTQTQDLYREVCVLLFFRYGMTPTANKLYQLVRKGSMTAPADALNKFWEDLREKSRVRIEHPDLPETLKAAAGELTATLWAAAQAAANDSLAAYRSEAQATVLEANAALASATSECDDARHAFKEAQQSLSDAAERISTLDQQLAAAGATNAALESQIQHAKEGATAQQQRLEDARRDFAAELDKLHATSRIAEERFSAAQTRSLLEIDRERGVAIKLQKELDATRTTASLASERHRSDTAAAQLQLGDLRQKIGMLEGKFQAAVASRDLVANELKATQVQLMDASTHASMTRADLDNCRREIDGYKRIVTELQESAKRLRTPRKPAVSK